MRATFRCFINGYMTDAGCFSVQPIIFFPFPMWNPCQMATFIENLPLVGDPYNYDRAPFCKARIGRPRRRHATASDRNGSARRAKTGCARTPRTESHKRARFVAMIHSALRQEMKTGIVICDQIDREMDARRWRSVVMSRRVERRKCDHA
jgi:hypothetical protein